MQAKKRPYGLWLSWGYDKGPGKPGLFFCLLSHYHASMQTLFDPLAKLAALGAYARLVIDAQGNKSVDLTWSRDSRRANQRRGYAIRSRFALLLILQLDVPPGDRPRTVQQLVAMGRVSVAGGRFVLPKR